MELKKASRKKVKIRMSVAAPTGFGKTIASLLIAYGITQDWDKIAVIDTENESASLYSDHKLKTGFKIGEFNTIPLRPPFTPEKFTEAIKVCENAGMEVIILDSVTHVWNGEGGLLDSNNQLGGSFQSWAKTTPRYQKWLNSILHSTCHVITTNRKKQGYSMTQEGGKTKVEKMGMDDQIRDGYDYEMTIAFDIINNKHLAEASKDRTGLFSGLPEFIITEETGKKIKAWCEKGIEAVVEVDEPVKIEPMVLTKTITVDPDKKLRACKNIADLQIAYKSLSVADQTAFASVKDEMKIKLTPAKQTA